MERKFRKKATNFRRFVRNRFRPQKSSKQTKKIRIRRRRKKKSKISKNFLFDENSDEENFLSPKIFEKSEEKLRNFESNFGGDFGDRRFRMDEKFLGEFESENEEEIDEKFDGNEIEAEKRKNFQVLEKVLGKKLPKTEIPPKMKKKERKLDEIEEKSEIFEEKIENPKPDDRKFFQMDADFAEKLKQKSRNATKSKSAAESFSVLEAFGRKSIEIGEINQPSTSKDSAVPIKSIPSWQLGLMGGRPADSSDEDEKDEKSEKNDSETGATKKFGSATKIDQSGPWWTKIFCRSERSLYSKFGRKISSPRKF